MKKLLSVFLIILFSLSLFSGCINKNDTENDNSVTNESNNDNSKETVDFQSSSSDMFTERDTKSDYDENNAIKIKLNKNTAVSDSESVKISGSTVTITEDATYVISGELSDGKIIVDAPDIAKLQLVLDGVDITSKTSAALYILNADKVFLTLKEGTINKLSNGGSFIQSDENNIDASVFSKQDLTLNGKGCLK